MRFYSPDTPFPAQFAKFRTQVGRTNKMLGRFRQRQSFSNAMDEESYDADVPPLMGRDIQTGDTEARDARRGGRDESPPPPIPKLSPKYTVTNGTLDRTYDANATTTAELADVLYTLITDLKALRVGIH